MSIREKIRTKFAAVLMALSLGLGVGVVATVTEHAAPASAAVYTAYYYQTNCGYYEVTYGSTGAGPHFTLSVTNNQYLFGSSSGVFTGIIQNYQGAPYAFEERQLSTGGYNILYYSYAGFHRYC